MRVRSRRSEPASRKKSEPDSRPAIWAVLLVIMAGLFLVGSLYLLLVVR